MATPYTTGPALLYVGLPAESFTPRFLGTAESAPQIEHVKGFLPVMNDLAGQVYSFDDMYEGKEGFVRADLTRFNWPIYHVLANTTESDDEGTDDPGDIGSLMVTEDLCPVVWVRFPYNPLKPAMAALILIRRRNSRQVRSRSSYP